MIAYSLLGLYTMWLLRFGNAERRCTAEFIENLSHSVARKVQPKRTFTWQTGRAGNFTVASHGIAVLVIHLSTSCSDTFRCPLRHAPQITTERYPTC